MIDKISRFIKKNELIDYGDTIIAGISGGADSICLLCVLCKLRYKFNLRVIAVHVNHQLRETALRDQNFTEKICHHLEVEFRCSVIDVKSYVNKYHCSTEEAARILRYKAFEQQAEELKLKEYKIAVAHNMDDNAETMLFNMIRGTGIKGLIGIVPKRDNIIRPMLCVSRVEIENFLLELNLDYCTDETNLSDDYSRNKIRHNVIPICKDINEKALERFFELSNQLARAEDYLLFNISKSYDLACYCKNGIIHISKKQLLEMHPYIQSSLLLEVIAKAAGKRKDISSVHVEKLMNLFEMQVGKSISLPYNLKAVREYEGVWLSNDNNLLLRENFNELPIDKLSVDKLPLNKPLIDKLPLNHFNAELNELIYQFDKYEFKFRVLDADANMHLSYPEGKQLKWFDYDKIFNEINKEQLHIRYKKSEDFITINEEGSKKKLKNYYIDEKIPLELRKTIPVIAKSKDVVWVVGYRISSSYKIDNNTKKILEISYLEKE